MSAKKSPEKSSGKPKRKPASDRTKTSKSVAKQIEDKGEPGDDNFA